MCSRQDGENASVAYVWPSAVVDIRRNQSSASVSLRSQHCSRVRRPRTLLHSDWVDGGQTLCTCSVPRWRHDYRSLPIRCLAGGDSSGPNDPPEEGQVKAEEQDGRSDSWFSGLKVWFKGKVDEQECEGPTEKNGVSESSNDSELVSITEDATDDGTSMATLELEHSGSGVEEDESSHDWFRWPWQKHSDKTIVVQGQDAEAGLDQSESLDRNVPRRKKVTHTDSKPGGSLIASQDRNSDGRVGKSGKNASGLQETWDKVVEVIFPKMPNFDDWTKKKVKAKAVDEEVVSEPSDNGKHGTSYEDDSPDLPRSSSIRELYSPPSENSAEGESKTASRQQRGSKWPRMPWSRDESAPKLEEKGSDIVGKSKRPLGPRISTVETVRNSEKKTSESSSVSSSSVGNNEELQGQTPCPSGKGESKHMAPDENSDDPRKTDLPTAEDKGEKEPVLHVPVVRASQLRISHIDMASIPQRDVAAIRLIFGSETFFATETLSPPGGLIFRGNLRGEPKTTVTKLEERLAARLGDKYTLCLAEGEEDLRPVVVIVPTARDKRPATPRQRFFAVVIGLLTISTCIARGLYAAAFKPLIGSFYPVTSSSVLEKFFSIQTAISCTTAASIGIIILISQIVQRMVASRYKTRIALPYLIPSFQLGSFGAVVQLASPTPTREALFDIALSGAATLVLISLSLLLIGLRLSTTFSGVVPVPMSMASSSVVIGFLTRMVPHGSILVDYGRSLIGLHPLAVIGANCLTIAALNLLPIRQLDGGRIISALYGRRTAVFASRVTVMFLLLASTKSPYFVVFLAAVTFGPWNVDRPSKNELTEPDGVRTIAGYLFMLLMIGVLLPHPPSKFFGTL